MESTNNIDSNNAKENPEAEDCFPIMKLPQELRGVIYRLFPQDQVKELRHVCSQWRSEIDELYDFDGLIDDNAAYWEKLFQLRLVSCNIIHFVKDPPTYGLPATRLFKYPYLLRKLVISTSSTISPTNFYYLLSDYGSNLEELSLLLTLPLLNENLTSSLASFNLQKLKKLELEVSTIDGNNPMDFRSPISGIVFTQLLANPMQSLNYLKLELRIMGFRIISKFLSSVFSFLASRSTRIPSPSRLETLDFELIQGHHGVPVLEVQALHDSDLENNNFDGLKTFVNNINSLRVVSSSPVGVELWIDWLTRQRKLVSLDVDLLPVEQSVFYRIISNNYETLVHLEITDLTIWNKETSEPTPFDLTILQSCTNLKKLILDRNVIARRRFECAELINLINLPPSLIELALNFLNVLTNDFYLYFSSLELLGDSNLRYVTITQCGHESEYGINGSVLEKLINIDSISFVEISRLNFGEDENDAERIKLNRILTSAGYNENHSYFQYSKLQNIINEIELELNELIE